MLADWTIDVSISSYRKDLLLDCLRDLASDIALKIRGDVEEIDEEKGKATITAEAKIQSNLDSKWDDIFEDFYTEELKDKSVEIYATNEDINGGILWHYKNGEGTYCSCWGYRAEKIKPVIFTVNDDDYKVTFWVKDKNKLKENKYEDFIALIEKPSDYSYFIAEPFSEHNTLFYGVYVDWDEDIDDDDYENKCRQYLLEYHNHGKQVSIDEIYFESQNGKTTEEELTDIIALCCMDGAKEEDHENGCELLIVDDDWFFDCYYH